MLSTNAHAASLNSSEHLSPASYPPANRTLPPGATAVSQQRPVPAWPPTSTPTTSSPTASTPSPWLTSRRAPHRRCSNSTGHRGTHHTAALAALTGQPFGPQPSPPPNSFPWARPETGPARARPFLSQFSMGPARNRPSGPGNNRVLPSHSVYTRPRACSRASCFRLQRAPQVQRRGPPDHLALGTHPLAGADTLTLSSHTAVVDTGPGLARP